MPDRASDKHERLAAALERGMAMVHLDARCEGVRVPPHLSREAHLRLNLSYKFDPPDLSLGNVCISATLSFGGRRFPVQVPWTAIFAITSHATQEFWLYPEDMPPEVMERAAEVPPPTPPGVPVAVPMVPALQEVRASGSPAAAAEGDSPSPPGRRHLRIVK